MDAPKNTVNSADEDIIDLTDIIEKGAPQALTAKSPAGAELDAQLQDLFGGSSSAPVVPAGVESDIDALLSEMDRESTAPSPLGAPGIGGGERVVDPNEQLEMPGMAEVDSLLQSMDIPPQPDPQSSASTPPPAEDLDELLTSLLDSADSGAVSPEQVVPTPVLPAEPRAKETPGSDDFLDDLDALFQQNASKVASSTASAAPVPPPASSVDLLDDLDALLGSGPAAAPAAPAAPVAPSVAPPSAASVPVGKTAAAPASPASGVDLLDDLDALLGSGPVVAPSAAPAPPVAPPTSSAPAAGPDAPVPDISDMEGLALLLPAVGQKAATATASDPIDNDMLADLDAILDGTFQAPVTEPALDAVPEPDVAPEPTRMPEQPEAAFAQPAPSVVYDVGMEPPAAPLPAQEDAPAAASAHETWRAPLSESEENASAETFLPDALSLDHGEEPTKEDISRAAQELLDEKVMLDASVDNVDTEAWLERLDDALETSSESAQQQLDAVASPQESAPSVPAAPASAQEGPAPSPVVSLEELLRDGSPACTAFAHIVRSAVAAELRPDAEAAPLLAPVPAPVPAQAVAESVNPQVEELASRVALLEARYEAEAEANKELRERLATLDTHSMERLAALEARLGSLHAEEQAALSGRLDALEARLKPLETAAGAISDEDVSQLEQGQMALEDRLTVLEGRLHQSEAAWETTIERAAAVAAAKIIREEIAALLAE